MDDFNLRHYANPTVSSDFCVGNPISRLLTVCGQRLFSIVQCLNRFLNVKAVVAAFNQETALIGAFSVITNLRMDLFEAL